MPLDIDDVREQKEDRDEDGELLANQVRIEWDGNKDTIEMYPLVGGVLNKVAKYEDGLEELDPGALAVIFSTVYPDLEDIRKEDVRDLTAPYINALVEPIEEALPDEATEGN